ncbi:tetratricopeptide repeat protein [Synoicihabitans lomoniglobus]|uniref:Tetratricopeptide repeat protein n=1 Tax=Synoicihabitans lomoniglobus TaxID=2909285 RepID=A0AAE9ZWJ1_9BACT|nr:tetratricopeptide repeat protein [Opitutaceae bacterium LMO-M01]WED64736.1 tetratricopeptide repeat protein [Opitutaceae bacterium LMO-M01]
MNATSAAAQNATQLGTTALQEMAQDRIERAAFAEAVPFLSELDRRLRESTDSTAVRAREGILFYLGLGKLQQANLPGAAHTLGEFVTAYPDAPNAVIAQMYRGDAFYYQGRLADARALYEELRARYDPTRLDVAPRAAYWEHYADCVYAERDWDAGVEVFTAMKAAATQLFDRNTADEKRAKAGSYLLQAAMAQNDFEAALAALPDLSGQSGQARYDLALNLALMRGGDELYAAARHGEALYFYELVLPPATLQDFWTAEIERGEAEKARIAGIDWFAERTNQVESDLAQAKARLEQLGVVGASSEPVEEEHRAVSDYTGALHFRIARCYLARGRTHEAYWAFARLENTSRKEVSSASDSFLEEAVYGQVKMAAACGRDDRVRSAARRYLRTETFTRFIGDVGYELLQTEVREGNLLAVRELAEAFMARVRLDPNLQEAPKLIYLVGSTLMEQEDRIGLRERFEPMLAEYPDRGFSDGLAYWLGLVEVLDGNYPSALAHFETIMRDYPNGGYTEDAHYREGVCWYGLLKYGRARQKLDGFLQDYPESRLASEAYALLGDLAAAEGRTEAAINAYAAAQDAGALLNPPNMGYINHAVFQAGELFAAAARWPEMAEWFESYLRRWGSEGRAGDAIYQLGRAQVQLDRSDAMLDVWIEAILRFGNDPADTGPDLMLAEFPEHYTAVRGTSPEEVLRNALAIATSQRQTTLMLRLGAALRSIGVADAKLPRVTINNLDDASGAVLVQAAHAERARDPALALAAAERALARSPFAPFAAEAWRLVAEMRTTAGDRVAAIEAWRSLVENFPTSPHAVEARLREGDLQRERGAYADAIAAYREVLKVRQWRGSAWAEANYKVGLTHFESGDFQAAFGFCQRVYVLYGGVAQWAASAYLTSGLALEQLNRPDDAVATYRELIAQDRLQTQPAVAEAAQRLEALGI